MNSISPTIYRIDFSNIKYDENGLPQMHATLLPRYGFSNVYTTIIIPLIVLACMQYFIHTHYFFNCTKLISK